MTTATFISKEDDWAEENTSYWFDFDGTTYCIVDGWDADILDEHGRTLPTGPERDRVKAACVVTDALRERAAG